VWGLPGLGLTLADLAGAITRQEGACSAPGVCVNNNPGNLRAYRSDQPVDSRGIRIFPTYEDGYAALLAQEQANISRGLTLQEFFGGKPGVYSGYAPAADSNNPDVYARNVAGWLGISPDVPLSALLDGSTVTPDGRGGGVLESGPAIDAGESLDGVAVGALALAGVALLWAVS
jgi:hypothetical protein